MSEPQWIRIKEFIQELSDLCFEYRVKILNPENGEYELIVVDDIPEHSDTWWHLKFDSKEHLVYEMSLVTSSNEE